MKFVSYAQNFEDVMLWRALNHVENGFYIDIGAQDPVADSVSMAFYEHGWRGVHVEPTSQYSAKLRAARPDEIILQVAVGNGEGPLTFFEFIDTGLSTANPGIAQSHIDHGHVCHETSVPLVSLDTLLTRFGDRPIHWMKIDVEGLEKSVLESWGESSVRPWILVIESTYPMTQGARHQEWEQSVFDKGYDFVYFDGLNRFYVVREMGDLKQSFSSPPNVFDGFTLSGLASNSFCSAVTAKLDGSEEARQQAEEARHQAEAELHEVLGSKIWRWSKPLRALRKMIFRFTQRFSLSG